ncbi:hypothetical protein FLL45_02570 [Aliikangiella marina]|uniref:Uncharacterized protein n=1 Tax=Aliikangiella marina TaxID=1712262 RepID=A0A545TI00_9GAMM|nr:hypothetical protein [Aliikangiella marina]TQV76859.1 hypothetical protein FLL45_02570 [Aliikangiella marina]
MEFEASDVPNNPVSELVESLWKPVRNENSEVWWHLEPAGYYFIFEPKQSELLFSIQFSPNSSLANRKILFEAKVNLRNALMMFWRCAKKTTTFETSDTDWPKLDKNELENLRTKLNQITDDGF